MTATSSVAAPQARSIRLLETAVAVSVPGAEGACVSEPAGVEAAAMLPYTLTFAAASVARTRYR